MREDRSNGPLTGLGPCGCVEPYVRGFAKELSSAGYSALVIRSYLLSAAHFGRWMDSWEIAVGSITDKTVADFASHRCECPGVRRLLQRPSRRYAARVRVFVEHLRRLRVVPAVAKPVPMVAPPLVGFRTWMTNHRGATAKTIDRYERAITRMLPSLGDDFAHYDAGLVRRVLLAEARQVSRIYAKDFVSALRAFLRFHAAEGRCRPHLDRAVPAVPIWKLSGLPRYLEAADVDLLIDSCDLTRPHGVRDRAVILLLARLGLRAGDIVMMRLDDLDWDAGSVRVRGKGRKEVRLPLPQDVGEALIRYLVAARPTTDFKQVFLCVNAPIRPFATSATVSDIVRFAIQRAGITDAPSKGAHMLRHSAATTMLRSGVSLDVIAAVLRHQSSETTAYYAKVDVKLLQEIALPWPVETVPC